MKTCKVCLQANDHESGRVRGLLCWWCNVALGHLREDQRRILALAEYLSRASSQRAT